MTDAIVVSFILVWSVDLDGARTEWWGVIDGLARLRAKGWPEFVAERPIQS